MNNSEARKFLLKEESYFTLDLPEYFQLSNLLDKARKIMKDYGSVNYQDAKELNKHKTGYEKRDDLNQTIYIGKDGFYSWRPLKIMNPFLYIDLVDLITANEDNSDDIGNGWEFIQRRFKQFQSNDKIFCASIPRKTTSNKTDLGVTILNWWEEIEQKTIEKSIDYTYCFFCDIANFYPSIYTHSIPWALYGKNNVKNNLLNDRKNFQKSFGNKIDNKIQRSQNNQTNGIHQGSVLMDFIAEIILGYIDLELTELINNEKSITDDDDDDYYIIRYRDDYRIFANNKTVIELILKFLQQVLLSLNLNLGPAKNLLTEDIVTDSIKKDKRYWEPHRTAIKASCFRQSDKGKISLQKHLLQIHELSKAYQNSGMINKSLTEFYKDRKSELSNDLPDFMVLISILVDIMYNNPNSISYCVIIISKLLENQSKEIGKKVVGKILKKFKKFKANTDHIEIWLQRLAIMVYKKGSEELAELFNSKICKKVIDDSITLFPQDWMNTSYVEPSIVNLKKFKEMSKSIKDSEIDILTSVY